MRWIVVAVMLAACGPSEDDSQQGSLERRAREALARDGWSEVRVEPAQGEPEGSFDFAGLREGRSCEGTIHVRVIGDRATSSMQSRCD